MADSVTIRWSPTQVRMYVNWQQGDQQSNLQRQLDDAIDPMWQAASLEGMAKSVIIVIDPTLP